MLLVLSVLACLNFELKAPAPQLICLIYGRYVVELGRDIAPLSVNESNGSGEAPSTVKMTEDVMPNVASANRVKQRVRSYVVGLVSWIENSIRRSVGNKNVEFPGH